MKRRLVVTAVGEDRPGIVARLTEVFVRHGANVEDSRMAILGGEFAAIVLITIPGDSLDVLESELKALAKESIAVTTKVTECHDPSRFSSCKQFDLTVCGADHEGIVHTVSRFLHERSINIESMETDIVYAPETAIPLFQLKAVVLVPNSVNHAELSNSLTKVGSEQAVDIFLVECEPRHSGAKQLISKS